MVEAGKPCRKQTTSLIAEFTIHSVMDIPGAILLLSSETILLIFYKAWSVSTVYVYSFQEFIKESHIMIEQSQI